MAEFSPDLEEQLLLFLFVALSFIGVVGGIAVLPHGEHDKPQLVNQLGEPDIASVPLVEVVKVHLLEGGQV